MHGPYSMWVCVCSQFSKYPVLTFYPSASLPLFIRSYLPILYLDVIHVDIICGMVCI